MKTKLALLVLVASLVIGIKVLASAHSSFHANAVAVSEVVDAS